MGCGSTKVAPAVTPSIAAVSAPATKRHTSPPPPYKHIPDQKLDLQILTFHAFIEFPTPHLLRAANQMYTQMNRSPPHTENGELLPYPGPSSKDHVFRLSSFEAIDKFALEVSVIQYQKSVEEFTDYLTKPHRRNAMATARVIFRWLAAQDIDKYATMENLDTGTVAWNLHKIKENNAYFCELFIEMCRHVGFQCKIIRGYAKHAHLEPGETPKDTDSSRWVAMVINNEWRLVDPHWGSSHMVGGGPGDWVLIDDDGRGAKEMARRPEGTGYSYDETYFLTNPEQYIYSHFPTEDASWQFLARSVTLREFTDMAYLKPAFFDLGLKLLDHRKCVLYASEGEIEIRIGTPPDKSREFMYRLWIENKQSIDDITLDRFCVVQQKSGILVCRIYFPAVGKFKLDLFAKDSEDSTGGNFYQMVCAYIIHADKACEDIKAFPKNTKTEWGPSHDLLKVGLHPVTHHDAVIEADDGIAEVRFKYDKPVEILHNLHSNDKTNEELKDNVIHYMDTEKGEVVLNMRLPEVGDYALELYAKEEGKEGSFPNVCTYIVSTATNPSNPSAFPDVTNGRLGALFNKNAPKLKLISHKSPIILCPDSGELDLEFQSSILCQVMNHLDLHVDGQKTRKEGYVWTTHKEHNKINFRINFPEPGPYTLDIFAKNAKDDKASYPCAYRCVINVPLPKPECSAFPETYGAWTPGCKLLEPMASVIKANSKVKFEAVIPQAIKVTTIAGDKWTYLDKGSDGVWRGEVDTGDPGILKLASLSKEGSTSYSTLMEYKVEEDTKLKEQERQQKQIQEDAKRENDYKRIQEEKEQRKRIEAFEKAKRDLLNAIQSRDLDALRKAVKIVERQKYTSRLHDEVEIGKRLIKSLERIRKLNKAVLDMDQTTMLEIKNYGSPPKLVHEVIVATLLLLGNSEDTTKEWPNCQKQLTTIGKEGLHRRIKTFDVTSLHPEIASRALAKIGNYRLEDVSDVSAGAGTFYAWTAGMIEEVQISNEGKLAPPADIKRQQEILSGKGKKKTRKG